MDIVNYIMACIQFASVVVLINGSPSSFFRPSSRLRQGCPLSHFLFLLIGDALNILIQQSKSSRSYTGVKVSDTKELSHILIVDDVVIMGEGTLENIK